MARRIDIELTSARADGTWTWRAAGALNPRGALDGSLLYNGAKTGDVVRAEAEFDLEGMSVVSVEPPRAREEADPNRIELVGRPSAPEITTDLVRGRPGLNGRDRPGLNGRSERRSPPRPRLQQAAAPARRDGRPHGGDFGPGARQASAPAPADRRPRIERQARREAPERSERAARPTAGPGRAGPGRPSRPPHEGASPSERRPGPRRPAQGATAAPRARRLNPANAHRTAMLETLPPEQQLIAHQLLRGGIPAVRTALHFERERAREEGRPEPSTEGVLALAESLLPRVKAAEWRDRAEAAVKAGDDLSMRDLRSLVTGSDVARDEGSRELAVELRDMLERRVEAQWTDWQTKITADLDAGHVARALRLSSRPPESSARFPADLATRLRDAAGAAMSADTPPEQWLVLLQAVVDSPVRRTVKPAGLPYSPSVELLEAARQQCGRVPALAPLLGLAVPPPPGPSRPGAARRTFGTPARTRARSASRRAGPADAVANGTSSVALSGKEAATATTDAATEAPLVPAEASTGAAATTDGGAQTPHPAPPEGPAPVSSHGQPPRAPDDEAQPLSAQGAPDAQG